MNDIIGIDLSLRSTGIVHVVDKTIVRFSIFDPNPSIKDEELFVKNSTEMTDYILERPPKMLVIEGFSFGASSGEKDKIHANFWMLRTELWKRKANIPIKVIPVNTWRSPLFTKEERKGLLEATKQCKAEKVPIKGLKGDERKLVMERNKILEQRASVKEATVRKLPFDVFKTFDTFITETGRRWEQIYDLTDGYFLASHFMK